MDVLALKHGEQSGGPNFWLILLTFACLTVTLPLSLLSPESGGLPIYLMFLLFCIQLIHLRGGLLDPFVIFSLGTFLYGFVPFIGDIAGDELIEAFGFQGGQAVFAYAMHAMVFAFLLTSIVLPERPAVQSRIGQASRAVDYDRIARIALVLSALLSLILEGVYALLH